MDGHAALAVLDTATLPEYLPLDDSARGPAPDLVVTITSRDKSIRTLLLPGERGRFVIGRGLGRGDRSVDLVVADRYASRRHLELSWMEGEGWRAVDLDSANGTEIEDRPLTQPVPIRGEVRLRIGTTALLVRPVRAGSLTEPQAVSAAETISGADDLPLPWVPEQGGTGSGDETLVGHRIPALVRRRSDSPAVAVAVHSFAEDALEAERRSAQKVTPVEPGGRDTLADMDTMVPTRGGTLAERSATGTLAGDSTSDAETMVPRPTMDTDRRQRTRTIDAPLEDLPGGVSALAATPSAPRPSQATQMLGGAGNALRGIALELVESNLLAPAKAIGLMDYARGTGRGFFRALADDNSVPFKDAIYRRVAANLGLPLIEQEADLVQQAEATLWLPFSQAEQRGVVLLKSPDPGILRYATIDPFDLPLDDWIRRMGGESATTQRIVVLPQVLVSAIQRLKNRAGDSNAGEIGIAIDIDIESERRIQREVSHVEVPQIVNYLLHRGFVQGASDIHVEPTEEMLLIRNRVDGIMHDDTTLPMGLHPEVTSRLKIIAGMDVAEKRRPQDGRISVNIRNTPIDVRLSTFPTVYGEKIVLRLLDKNALRPSPESLGLLPRSLQVLRERIASPYGLIMISGPTGSGKTTTLYSCLGHIDKKSRNVLTIEDPVEYRLKGVHQMQVNERIGLTFASGLRTILRQDPDVIMIGECRDRETASMAIQAALTGHIVFSTIHTNDAVGVVTRLLDMGIDAYLVCNSLTLAVAQRLVRRVCQQCRGTASGADILARFATEGISAERLARLGIEVDEEMPYVVAQGCQACRNTGYSGRQAVFELFEMTSEARAEIMSPSFNADNLRRLALSSGMTTLIGHGMRLVDDGQTTLDEIIRVLGETY